jgi:hypothetical protein
MEGGRGAGGVGMNRHSFGICVLTFYYRQNAKKPWALNQGRRVNKRSSQLFFQDFLYF